MTPFAAHQSDMAQRLGYGTDVARMNRDHDPLHRALCDWLGIVSHSMRDAAGETLTEVERALACQEEAAVLAIQALAVAHGVPVPRVRRLPPLTPREHKIAAIIARHNASDVSPSLQEIADELGLKSKGSLYERLASIERKGWLEKRPRYATRALRLTRPVTGDGS